MVECLKTNGWTPTIPSMAMVALKTNFGSNSEYPTIQFWNLLLINTFFSIHNITKLWMCSNNLLFQELHDWMKVSNEHFVCSHFKKTLFTIALWLSCNGKWGLGIFHFQDHFNGKSHFLCISPLNRKNYHCCQWMIPQKKHNWWCYEISKTINIPLPWKKNQRDPIAMTN